MTDSLSNATALDEAIQWAVRLTEGQPSNEEFAAFSHWKDADVRHRSAWESLERRLNVFASVRERDGPAARRVLTATQASRRKLLRDSLGALAAFGIFGAAVKQFGIFDSMVADLSTDIGSRRRVALADQSLLTLDGHSAVDVRFNARERAIHLLKGQLYVRVAHDPYRPFVVHTRDGTFTALGTEFCVGLNKGATRLAVTHSVVRAQGVGGVPLDVTEGQVVTLGHADSPIVEPLQAESQVTWLKGYVTAIDQPLGDIVEALNRYLHGFVVMSAEAAALKISGLFVLDDAQAAIRQIAETLPVEVTYHTEYLIRITAR